MDGQKKEETEQLDDLLDEILQKNMEEAVSDNEDTGAAKDNKSVDLNPKTVDIDPVDDDEILTPEEYLEDVFGDGEVPDPTDTASEEDIRVIEVEESAEEEDSSITKRDILTMLLYVVIIFLLTFVIVHYVGQRTRVSGSSMENTLSNGDNLIVDKLSYRFSDPERFDVIIFPFQYEEDTYYIKRIIGLPGETVQIGSDGTIYINGEVLEEEYGLERIMDPGMAIDPITGIIHLTAGLQGLEGSRETR